MKRIFSLSLILFLFCSQAWGEIVDSIAAVVNNDIITVYQIDRELEKRQFGEGGLAKLTSQSLAEVRQQALGGLIEETLVQQQVKKLGLSVTDEEVEAAISDVLLQNHLTREELIQALKLQGMDFDVYKDNLRKQILRFKLLGQEVKSKVDVSNQELLDYFRAHIDDYRQKPTVHIAIMTFPLPAPASNEQIGTVRQQADEALAKLKAGDDFFSVLLEYSADHRAQGGDLGTFGAGELTPAFDRAIEGLKDGDVSGVVETPDAFHILKVIGRQAGSVRQFDAVKDEIAKTLTDQKTDEAFKAWAEGLRKSAYIDIRLK